MGRERDPERRKQLRKNRQNVKRQNSLITDYIEHKYANIYAEAFEFYKNLDDKYPDKTNLRKTEEYKFWKFGSVHLTSQPQEQEPKEYTDNLQLNIPIKRYRTVKQGQSVTTQTLSTQEQSSTAITTQTLSTQEQSSTAITTQTLSTQEQSSTAITTQTLSTQEQSSTIQTPQTPQPTQLEELPHDLVQEMINELKEDPHMMNMFDTIEGQLDFEELDIEIPDSLLEKELQNW